MPELPEIETIKREAQRVLKGRKILRVEILDTKPVRWQEKDFCSLKGSIKNIRRFGKILVFDLSSGKSILIHLKLTGQLVYQEGEKKVAGGHYEKGSLQVPNKFTRLIFHLDKGTLYFNDLRKFGYLKLVPTNRVGETKEIKELGPEPLSSDFSLQYFSDLLRRTKRAVKIVLMDQKKISGVGNIYANEALFWAKIRPDRPANSLSPKEIKALYQALKKVLKKGIELKGASENTYVDLFGRKGRFMEKVAVYQRDGQPCPLCGMKIKKITLGGRSAYFCPHCQK